MENELEVNKPKELKDNTDLHERFVKIFSDVNKNNPINISIDKEAWPIFLKVVEDYSHADLMNQSDADLVKKCISVQEIFFEQKNIITDGNGNPNIKANIKANPEFVRNNPEVLEVLENIHMDKFSREEIYLMANAGMYNAFLSEDGKNVDQARVDAFLDAFWAGNDSEGDKEESEEELNRRKAVLNRLGGEDVLKKADFTDEQFDVYTNAVKGEEEANLIKAFAMNETSIDLELYVNEESKFKYIQFSGAIIDNFDMENNEIKLQNGTIVTLDGIKLQDGREISFENIKSFMKSKNIDSNLQCTENGIMLEDGTEIPFEKIESFIQQENQTVKEQDVRKLVKNSSEELDASAVEKLNERKAVFNNLGGEEVLKKANFTDEQYDVYTNALKSEQKANLNKGFQLNDTSIDFKLYANEESKFKYIQFSSEIIENYDMENNEIKLQNGTIVTLDGIKLKDGREISFKNIKSFMKNKNIDSNLQYTEKGIMLEDGTEIPFEKIESFIQQENQTVKEQDTSVVEEDQKENEESNNQNGLIEYKKGFFSRIMSKLVSKIMSKLGISKSKIENDSKNKKETKDAENTFKQYAAEINHEKAIKNLGQIGVEQEKIGQEEER